MDRFRLTVPSLARLRVHIREGDDRRRDYVFERAHPRLLLMDYQTWPKSVCIAVRV